MAEGRSGRNKESLLHFLVSSWKQAELPEEFVLYATDREECVRPHYKPGGRPSMTDIPCLQSDHEEAAVLGIFVCHNFVSIIRLYCEINAFTVAGRGGALAEFS